MRAQLLNRIGDLPPWALAEGQQPIRCTTAESLQLVQLAKCAHSSGNPEALARLIEEATNIATRPADADLSGLPEPEADDVDGEPSGRSRRRGAVSGGE